MFFVCWFLEKKKKTESRWQLGPLSHLKTWSGKDFFPSSGKFSSTTDAGLVASVFSLWAIKGLFQFFAVLVSPWAAHMATCFIKAVMKGKSEWLKEVKKDRPTDPEREKERKRCCSQQSWKEARWKLHFHVRNKILTDRQLASQ